MKMHRPDDPRLRALCQDSEFRETFSTMAAENVQRDEDAYQQIMAIIGGQPNGYLLCERYKQFCAERIDDIADWVRQGVLYALQDKQTSESVQQRRLDNWKAWGKQRVQNERQRQIAFQERQHIWLN